MHISQTFVLATTTFKETSRMGPNMTTESNFHKTLGTASFKQNYRQQFKSNCKGQGFTTSKMPYYKLKSCSN